MGSRVWKFVGVGLVGAAVAAAGLYTADLPLVGPLNLTYQPLGQQVTGQLPYLYSQLYATQGPQVGVDTHRAQGQSPQTVAASLFQVVGPVEADVIGNTATSTAAAATLNTLGGLITTEALTTAAGGTYTFTLTNSLLTAGQVFQVVIGNGTNTASYGQVVVTSEVTSAGSAVLVFTNNGTTALNGTMKIAFHL